MGKILRLFSLAFLFLMNSRTAQAEPFTVLPNGELVFNVSLTTDGVFATGSGFACGTVVSCSGSGTNSLTIQSGTGTVTLTFTGVNTSMAVGNTTIPVMLGTFEGSITPGFSLPDFQPPHLPFFGFGLSLTHSSPVAAATGLFWQFNSNFTRFGETSGTYLVLPAGPQPPPFQYTYLVYSTRVFPLRLPLNGSQDIVADVGAVPEPASIVLVSTGLLGALYRRRMRRRSRARDDLSMTTSGCGPRRCESDRQLI